MSIKAAFWPMSGKKDICPYTPNQKLLDIRPSSTSAVSGSIEILADGRFKLELEAAGGAGSGWQDENVWAGGGSAAAIVVEVSLTAGKYLSAYREKPKLPVFGHPAARAVRLILRAATLQQSILRLRVDKALTAKPKMPAARSAALPAP